MLDHRFNGTAFTIGIEEELMLLDPETLDLAHGIEEILAALPPELEGQVKTELFQSVLEIATLPCANLAEAIDGARGSCVGPSPRWRPSTRCGSGPREPTPSPSAPTSGSSSASATWSSPPSSASSPSGS